MYRGQIVSPATTYPTAVVARSTQAVLTLSVSHGLPTGKTPVDAQHWCTEGDIIR